MSIILKNEAEKNIEHTIIIYAKNIFGILERILNVFSEKLIAIESINSILLERQEKYKIIIISKFKKEYLVKIIEEIKKQIDSDEIECYIESQLIYNELAFYKISYDYFINNGIVQSLIEKHQAKIVEIKKDFVFIEKIGETEQIFDFLNEISPYGLIKFNRSGKIVMTKN